MHGGHGRIYFVAILFIVIASTLSIQLFIVQIVRGDDYAIRVQSQYENESERIYDRGTIYFRRKDGELLSAAGLQSGHLLAIQPDNIEDAQHTYSALSKILELDEEEFITKANKLNDPYEEIAAHLSTATADEIRKLKLPGVELYPDVWRTYSGEKIAAHVLGYVGFSKEGYSGRYGVERYYEDLLIRNTDSKINIFSQIFEDIQSLLSFPETRTNGNIVLTIEPVVQTFLEKELENIWEVRQPEEVGGIVIDPSTGEIIAMAALPAFSPAKYYEEEDISVFTNPLVENVYEMGSIVKPLTLAAALDADVLTEKDTYEDKGFVEISNRRIENYDGIGRGTVLLQEILNESLNTGAVHVQQELGKEAFKEYMFAYGLGEKTMIDLPDEVNGIVTNLDTEGDVEFATASFGQGIAVTPINIVRALSTLANGGLLIRPHVVSEFKYKGLPNKIVRSEEQRKVLKTGTSERISRMLVEVVDEALLGGSASIDKYTIAAKTGTAQISNPEGGYYEDQFLHSFFGYFPAFDPKFLVFIYINKPSTGRYASETLTEPFMNHTQFLLNYYEIPPDR